MILPIYSRKESSFDETLNNESVHNYYVIKNVLQELYVNITKENKSKYCKTMMMICTVKEKSMKVLST